jgi:hypothetical protein
MLALWSKRMVCFPLYDSFDRFVLTDAINRAELSTVFVQRSKLGALLRANQKNDAAGAQRIRHGVLRRVHHTRLHKHSVEYSS